MKPKTTWFLTVMLVSGVAQAQRADGFSGNRFEPAARGSTWFTQDSLSHSGKLSPAFGATLDYNHRSLVLYTADGAPDYSVLRHRLDLHLGASLTFLDRFRVDATMPFAIVNAGDEGIYRTTTYRAPYRSPVQGDARLGVDARALTLAGGAARLGGGMRLWIPTGDAYSYSGDNDWRWSPYVSFAGDYKRVSYAARASYMYRGRKTDFGNGTVGNEFGAGLALGVKLLEARLLVGPELTWATRASALSFTNKTTPVEVLAGGHFALTPALRLNAGIGAGLTTSIGDPSLRVLASLDYAPAIESPPDPAKLPAPAPAPDRDGDGFPDALDRCPSEPGARFGCADADADGVLDAVDACPNDAGPSTSGGCPDADVDAIPDAVDACKTEPGVANADPNRNGCPAPKDSDGDGIADPDDACPDKAGPASSDRAKQGCPIAELKVEEIAIRDQVLFGTGSAVIDEGASEGVLRAVLKVLEQHPELKLRIEGHTDNVGDAKKNLALSSSRAAAVVDWLRKHGIDAARMTSKGLGSSKPIADTSTEAGRSANRRVEFHIVQNTVTTPARPAQ